MHEPAYHRRRFLAASVPLATLVASGITSTGTAAQQTNTSGWAKIVFVLHRKGDLSHERCVAEWMGAQHTGIVGKVPGLRRWVQNHPESMPDGAADGLGELWFDDAQTLARAMSSPEMAAAIEDAKRFLDLQKTYALMVTERTIVA